MFKRAFFILKNNMIFIQPLLIWQVILAAVLFVNETRIQTLYTQIGILSSILLLFIACLSGCLYINKLAVLTYNEKDNEDEVIFKTIQNLKKFFEGIGSDFLRVFFACILIIIFYFITFYFLIKYSIINFGIPSFIDNILPIIQEGTREQLIQFLNNISEHDKIISAKWILTANVCISMTNFFSLLYLTILSFERKNFIISFFKAIKFYIINIFEIIGIIIFMFAIYMLINILSLILGANSLLFAVLVIILTLYFNYYILLVFCFYEGKTKDNSNSRCKCNREDEISNRTS